MELVADQVGLLSIIDRQVNVINICTVHPLFHYHWCKIVPAALLNSRWSTNSDFHRTLPSL